MCNFLNDILIFLKQISYHIIFGPYESPDHSLNCKDCYSHCIVIYVSPLIDIEPIQVTTFLSRQYNSF